MNDSQPSPERLNLFVTAASVGKIATVRRFLDGYPRFVDAKDTDGMTALRAASRKGQDDVVILLLGRGANIHSRNFSWGMTVLMEAAAHGRKSTAELLIRRGALVNEMNDAGDTVLVLAIQSRDKGTVEVLLENGAAADTMGSWGQTPATYAQGTPEIAALIERWPEILRGKQAEKKRQERERYLKDTSFSGGLEKPIRAPRPIKIKPGAP
jgi:ankyrin repeat protein